MKILRRVFCSNDTNENDIQEVEQEYRSENTSINSTKLPAIFKMVTFQPGTTNLDYGGGKFDNVADYLAEQDVTNLVYDPYNRSAEHNRDVIQQIRNEGGADTATCSNVLNVIKEPEARLNVLKNISKLVKPNGNIYITVYEGSGKGDEGPTRSGYQLNKKTGDYLEEIQQVFPDARRKGKLIIATNQTQSQRDINSSTADEGYVYSYCDNCGKKNRVKACFPEWNGPFEDTEYECRYCGTRNMLTDSHEYDNDGYITSSTDNSKYSKLLSKLRTAVKNAMLSFGFESDEIDKYSSIDIDSSSRIEIRAELDYDQIDQLCEILNPIVEKYDRDSYFEPVQPGIIEAYVEPDNINSASRNNLTSVKSSDAGSYDKYAKVSRSNQNFSVHYNEIYNDPSADAHQMWLDFRAQVSMLRPYDDAEYAWAQIQDGQIRIIKNNKVIQKYNYLDADDMDVDNVEWCDEVIDQAIYYLSEANANIEPRIIHNSIDISAQSIQANQDYSRYEEIASKQVYDSDGFTTDYTMYEDNVLDEYIFIFGDKDLYRPEDTEPDWTADTEEDAWNWFNSYEGFTEDDYEL